MRVSKYLPEKLYGFCQDEAGEVEVFFHLACFYPGTSKSTTTRCSGCSRSPHCKINEVPPPPILGEEVLVEFEASSGESTKAPRAVKVERLEEPQMLLGSVESFEQVRRYGFVLGTDQVTYHLHQSEIVDGKLPLVGSEVTFYPGVRSNRPRACHVRVCR